MTVQQPSEFLAGKLGATATATFANGAVRSITVTNFGSGYQSPPTVAFSGGGGGSGAAAIALFSNGVVTGLLITNGGSGYMSAPTITISGGGGTSATATAVIGNGVVNSITLTNAGTGYTSTPTVTLSGGGGGTGAVAVPRGLTMALQPKAIQELFTVDYGRMNAALGVELPFTNMTTQTTIPLGFIDPPTEILDDSSTAAYIGAAGDGTHIWKITHNGVDTHFMHTICSTSR
jgi:hypothetical protein